MDNGIAARLATYAAAAFFALLAVFHLYLTGTAMFAGGLDLAALPWRLAAAWAAAIFVFAVILLEAWKGLTPDSALICAAICVAAAVLLWHGNVPMFVDADRALSGFAIVANVVIAVLAVLYAVTSERPAAGVAAALLACCAGAWLAPLGMAAFAALFATLVVVRAGFLAAFVALLAIVAAAALRFWLAHGTDLAALEALGRAALPAAPLPMVAMGALPIAMLKAVPGSATWILPVAFAFGLLALVPTAVSIGMLWLRRHFFTRIECLAVALFFLGVAAELLIVVGGARTFVASPDLLLSPSYLFWSCVTWAGVGLLLASRLAYASPSGRTWGLGAIALAAIAAIPGR